MDDLDDIYDRLQDDMKDRRYAGPKMKGLASGVLGSSGIMGLLDFLNVFGTGGGLFADGGRVGLAEGSNPTQVKDVLGSFGIDRGDLSPENAPGFGMQLLDVFTPNALVKFVKDTFGIETTYEEAQRLMEETGFADGGRVGMQTGGTPDYQEILQQIQDSTADMEQTNVTLPSPQVQALQGVMGPLMAQQLGTPIDTSAFAPQAAAQTGLQQAAAQQAATQAGLGTLQFDPTTGQLTSTGTGTGIAGYQPFLDQAATDINAASAAAAAGQGAGATALGQAQTAMDAAQQAAVAGQDAGAQFMGPQAYQQFMSPYQQDVIDTTLASYTKT